LIRAVRNRAACSANPIDEQAKNTAGGRRCLSQRRACEAGEAGTRPLFSCTYTAGGATSSKNKPLVYLFDWGNGNTSGWLRAGRTTASHTWAAPGISTVPVLAADAADLLIQSNPSTGFPVEIRAP
jgi:hypothetical protein